MNNTLAKKIIPHVIAYVVMLVISFAFYAPAAFQGKVLNQYDNVQAKGMQAELMKYKKETGVMPQWTNACFSGMPAYQVQQRSTKNLATYPLKVLLLFQSMLQPHIASLLLMFGMYLLLAVVGIDWRIALAGAIGFGLSADHVVLTEAGHSTKLIAIAFIAPIVAGVIMTFRGKYLIGAGITGLFLSFQLMANHLQITYYLFILFGILGIFYFIDALKNGTLPNFAKATAISAIAALLAVGTGTTRMWTTYEYSSESIRGESELTGKDAATSSSNVEGGGLAKWYIFNWSYGKYETLNLMIPNAVGGTNKENFVQDKSSKSYKALGRIDPKIANEQVRNASHYWGAQPGTSGPVYIGAIMCFLFFVGAFLVKGPLRPWIIASTIFLIVLAWGKNFLGFNSFMVDYFPMYGKFRAVTMALSVVNFLVVFLGILGLQELFKKEHSQKQKLNALYFAGGITGGICLLLFAVSGGMSYGTEGKGIPDVLASALIEDRMGLLRADILRTLGLIAVAFGVLWAYASNKVKPLIPIAVLLLLILVDNWTVGRRFIDSTTFETPRKVDQQKAATAADLQIQKDPDLHFRVANFESGNPFSNAIASYHHKSIGGYHAAKMMRYQELVERYLSNPGESMHVYGMLNTKYLIQGGKPRPLPDALGNAWFVSSFDVVPNGDAEMAGLASLQPKEKALIQDSYAGDLKNFNLQYDPSASIKLTGYHPDKMEYTYSAASDQLAVFSEIYYPPSKGWNVYLDGQQIEGFTKANFLLRAMKLPAGQNRKLEMKFEPRSFYVGENIVLVCSLLILLGFFGGLFLYFKSNEMANPENLPIEAATATKLTKTVATSAKRTTAKEKDKKSSKKKKKPNSKK